MKHFDRILAVAGESDKGNAALAHATALAAANDAELTVVDVKPYLDEYTRALADIMPGDELRELVLAHRREQLERLLKSADKTGERSAQAKVLDGVPFIEIIREAVRGRYGLIVKAAESEFGPRARIFGSTDMHLMRKSPVPILVINPETPRPATRIMAAVDALSDDDDADPLNRRILTMAQAMVDVAGAELHVLSAWELIGEDAMRHSPFLKIGDDRVDALLHQTEARLQARQSALLEWYSRTFPSGGTPAAHRIRGEARQVIGSFVDDQSIDLAVMGTVGRAGVPGLLIGNTAETVLSDVGCSVLTIKPEGFLTPVTGD